MGSVKVRCSAMQHSRLQVSDLYRNLTGLGFEPPAPDDGKSSMRLNPGMITHADAYPGERVMYYGLHERGSG